MNKIQNKIHLSLHEISEFDDSLKPSDRVWKGIEQELFLKKKKRYFFISISAYLLAFIFISCLVYDLYSKKYLTKNRISELSEIHTNLPIQLQNKGNDSKKINRSETFEKATSIASSEINSLDKVGNKILETKNFENAEKVSDQDLYLENPISKNPLFLNLKSQSTGSDDDLALDKNNENKVEDFFGEQQSIEKEAMMTNLQQLSGRSITSLSSNNSKMEIPHQDIILKTNLHKNTKRYFGIYSGFPVYYDQKNLSIINGNELVKASKRHDLFELGLIAQKTIKNKLSIYIGVGLYKQALSTKYDLNVSYDYNTETEGKDILINSFNHSLPTIQGDVNANMIVTREKGSPVHHNENVNLNLEIIKSNLYLSNDVGFLYHFKDKYKGPYIGLGTRIQISLKEKITTQNFHSNHALVKEHSSKASVDTQSPNLYLLQKYLIGYTLPINTTLINLQGEYRQPMINELRSAPVTIQMSLLKQI